MLLRSNILLFCFLAGISLSMADGGNKIGNGGDVVDCRSTLELLDFFEGSEISPTALSQPEDIAKEKFLALQKVDPKTATLYLRRLEVLKSEIEFRKEVQLTDVPDSKHLLLPKKNCELVQIAIRKAFVTANEKRFVIRDDLWRRLSPLHKAGLLSHEIIYEHFAKLGETDSIKARKLNGFLFGSKVTAEAYWELMKSLELPIYP